MSMKLLVPALLVALAPLSQAAAHPSRAGLLLDDAPRVAAITPTAEVGERLVAASEGAPAAAPLGLFAHFGVTLLPSIFASTAGVALAVGLGALSNTLLGAALPALLAHLFVGPALTTLTAFLVGRARGVDGGFWGAAGAAFLLHAATFFIASWFLVVPWTSPAALLLYTAVDGALTSAGAVGVMHALAKRPPPTELPSFIPQVAPTQLIALTRVEL